MPFTGPTKPETGNASGYIIFFTFISNGIRSVALFPNKFETLYFKLYFEFLKTLDGLFL